MPCVILMGIKHCGKSTQGRLLAEELALPFYDTDDLVHGLSGRTPRELYAASGEAVFQAAELDACGHLARLAGQGSAVVATGGGICNNPPAVQVLKGLGTCVFLLAQERAAADRIVREIRWQPDGTPGNLPAYIARSDPRTEAEVRALFHAFYRERTQKYAALADVTVTMLDAPKLVNTARIRAALEAVGALSLNQPPHPQEQKLQPSSSS